MVLCIHRPEMLLEALHCDAIHLTGEVSEEERRESDDKNKDTREINRGNSKREGRAKEGVEIRDCERGSEKEE